MNFFFYPCCVEVYPLIILGVQTLVFGYVGEQNQIAVPPQPLTHQRFNFEQWNKIIRNRHRGGGVKNVLIMIDSVRHSSRFVLCGFYFCFLLVFIL